MKSLKELLETLIAEAEKDCKVSLEKISTNTLYQFAWHGENLYKSANMIAQVKSILEQISSTDADSLKDDKTLKEKVTKYLTEKVLIAPLMDRSSGQLHSLTSLWSKEVSIAIIEKIKWG